MIFAKQARRSRARRLRRHCSMSDYTPCLWWRDAVPHTTGNPYRGDTEYMECCKQEYCLRSCNYGSHRPSTRLWILWHCYSTNSCLTLAGPEETNPRGDSPGGFTEAIGACEWYYPLLSGVFNDVVYWIFSLVVVGDAESTSFCSFHSIV